MFRRWMITPIVVLVLLALLIPLTIAHAQPFGVVRVRDSGAHDSGTTDKLVIALTGLAKLAANTAYEGWLVSDDDKVKLSTGILNIDEKGNVNQTFNIPGGKNVFVPHGWFGIGIEPVPDPDPNPSGKIAYVHRITAGGLVHIRHQLYSLPGNPPYASGPYKGTPKGISVGLLEQSDLARARATASVNAATLAELRSNAEQVINIVEGSKGAKYGDGDGNGAVENPGDGFGVLNYAKDARIHAFLAFNAAPGELAISRHYLEVAETSDNVAAWSSQARDQALLALGTTSQGAAQAFMKNAELFLVRAHDGYDANADGAIASVIGEGGAHQTYTAAQNMGTFVPTVFVAPPKAGDVNYGTFAMIAVLAGAVLLLVGGAYLYRRSHARA